MKFYFRLSGHHLLRRIHVSVPGGLADDGGFRSLPAHQQDRRDLSQELPRLQRAVITIFLYLCCSVAMKGGG